MTIPLQPIEGKEAIKNDFCIVCCAWVWLVLFIYKIDHIKQKCEVRELGRAVPPGVACVSHVPPLRVGVRVHQAPDLDALAFGALAPDV